MGYSSVTSALGKCYPNYLPLSEQRTPKNLFSARLGFVTDTSVFFDGSLLRDLPNVLTLSVEKILYREMNSESR